MQEVSHWADLPLDFLIIGLDGCGTTSLRRNLAKHPAAWTNQPTLHPLFGPKRLVLVLLIQSRLSCLCSYAIFLQARVFMQKGFVDLGASHVLVKPFCPIFHVATRTSISRTSPCSVRTLVCNMLREVAMVALDLVILRQFRCRLVSLKTRPQKGNLRKHSPNTVRRSWFGPARTRTFSS